MVDEELERLTLGEQLLLHRRRHGRNQREEAELRQVSLSRYSRWERDLEPGPKVLLKGSLAPYERCLLYRLRAGFTQARVATELGVCRHWVHKMETGEADCTKLACYWEQ